MAGNRASTEPLVEAPESPVSGLAARVARGQRIYYGAGDTAVVLIAATELAALEAAALVACEGG